MDKHKLLKASHEGKVNIGEIELTVAVLEDGRRIINQNAVFKAFGRPVRGSRSKDDQTGGKLPGLIDAKSLKPFISEELDRVIKPVKFITKEGKENQGYDSSILALICEVYLDALKSHSDKNPTLTKKQMPNALAAEKLSRVLMKISIIALIDEATGYQYEREKDELQQILKAYISEELLPWQKKFPDIFYKELFRLNKWDFTVNGIKKRPGVVGKWTNTLIYEQLPEGVLKEAADIVRSKIS